MNLHCFPTEWTKDSVQNQTELENLQKELNHKKPQTIVVVGSSISGFVVASRLAQFAERNEKVEILFVTGERNETPRLINGCTLRKGNLFRLAKSLECSLDELWKGLTLQESTFCKMRIHRFQKASNPEGFVLDRTLEAELPEPMGLSTRHGHLIETLCRFLPQNVRIRCIVGKIPAQSRYQNGKFELEIDSIPCVLQLPDNHLILNATPHLSLLRETVAVPESKRSVLAIQVPLRKKGTLAKEVLVLSRKGKESTQLSLSSPFYDPLLPEANAYMINTTVCLTQKLNKEAVFKDVYEGLVEKCEALGFELIQEEKTIAKACFPWVEQTGTQTQQLFQDTLPIVDIHRSFSPGATAVNTDGMLATSVGSDEFVTHFIEHWQEDLHKNASSSIQFADKKLKKIRFWNKFNVFSYFVFPAFIQWFQNKISGPMMPSLTKEWTFMGETKPTLQLPSTPSEKT